MRPLLQRGGSASKEGRASRTLFRLSSRPPPYFRTPKGRLGWAHCAPLLTLPPSTRQDASLCPARAFLFCHSLYTLTQGSGQISLYCAHRTSTVSSCAFCEQEGWSGRSLLTLLRPRVARARDRLNRPFS